MKNNMQLFTEGWSFLKTPLNTSREEIIDRFNQFEPVEIPHDWLIYDAQNLYEDSFGWYRKIIENPCKEGEGLQLFFEGVYMDCTLYVNGEKAGDWKYGYSSFTVDITKQLRPGENELLMLVRHQAPNSRWYSGAGIYRKVWMKKYGKAYLPIDGTYITTYAKERDAFANPNGCDFCLEVETEVQRNADTTLLCRYELYQGEKQELCVEEQLENPALGLIKIAKTLTVSKPLLWDLNTPHCYKFVTTLLCGKEELDRQVYTIGFRTMEFDPQKGFFLNGKQTKIHGVCEHHDLGCLGAAFNRQALKRKFEILRSMGVNGLRTSHNMPAPEFMELADEMGFVVMSEAFDMWERPKTTYDYGRFFKEWSGRDVRSWIRRDRNHPSLMLWSIGNEIYDTHADEHGQEITKYLIDYVREHDPKKNAPITIGSNYMPWEGAQKCADIVKYAGYNYSEKFYEKHHEEHPDWVIYGSETASVVQSRGIYHFPFAQSILSDEDEQCSSLGNSSTSWGADSIEQCIIDDRDAKFTFGMFIWTGFDYIGEPTPYHTKNSYFGQIDTAGFPKDAYYIFRAEWTDPKTDPMVHLFPYWDFNPGQMVDLRAATNGDSVELFVNDFSKGRQYIDHQNGQELVAHWRVPYEPGVICAVAYDKEGKEIARDTHKSFGDSKQISVSADKTCLKANGEDLCFLTIEMMDENGRPVENAVDYVTVETDGPVRLLGMDNGDSTDWDSYKCNTRKLFSGKLLAVLGSTFESGDITVTVKGEGVLPTKIYMEAVSDGQEQERYLEDCSDFCFEGKKGTIPVRKLELLVQGGQILNMDNPSVTLQAKVYPEAAETNLIWKVVNTSGIEVSNAYVASIDEEGRKVLLTGKGDGEFLVRCMAEDPESGKITVISQIEFSCEGIGGVLLNPYEMITGGLYSECFGEIGNGNEKGFSTGRNGDSGVCFTDVDFGEYGSDELTMPIFALDDQVYRMDIWLGKPFAKESRILDTVVYQKPSVWNTYQEETWKLPERIKGIVDIGFVTHSQKIHVKGFYFTYTEKALGELHHEDSSRLYGDSFEKLPGRLEKIGNNVTLEYDHMKFGQKGVNGIVIRGRTPLACNTIHLRFTPKSGETVNRMVEFQGCETYENQIFAIEKLAGEGRLDIIFLPGSQFDLEYIRFFSDEC